MDFERMREVPPRTLVALRRVEKQTDGGRAKTQGVRPSLT
jgi:hypothetical protein